VRRVSIRHTALVLLASLLLVTGCGSPGGQGGGSPAGGSSPEPARTSYPGWPGAQITLGSPDLVPVLVSSDVAVGPSRFMFTLVDGQNRVLASPTLAVRVGFYELAKDPRKPAHETAASFLWAIEGERGLYVTTPNFASPGDWGVEVTARQTGRPDRSARVVFPVREQSSTPQIGTPAPASETPRASDPAGIAKISSDERPDPDFYRLSVKDAVAAGKPAVIVFATPKFCTSRVCGPTLDTVKVVAKPLKDRVNFVHVEVYNLSEPNNLQAVPAVKEWRLPTEPWVFVVDKAGRIAAKFEAVVGKEELAGAISGVAR
jgi:hypothetical protein